MNNIVIIGAGNIGSRHLQGLKNIDFPLRIYVVDPNESSLKIAKERYNSIYNDKCQQEVIYTQSIEKFGELIDLAIIATNSKIRRDVIADLVELNKVKYLILEKILFQKEEDYYYILELLEKQCLKTWVNCARRSVPFYQELKSIFERRIQQHLEKIISLIQKLDIFSNYIKGVKVNGSNCRKIKIT